MKNVLNKERNFLTDYGFSCGYIEERKTDFEQVRIYKEHTVYIVSGVSYRNNEPFDTFTFEKLTDAKKLFFDLCTKYNLIHFKKR